MRSNSSHRARSEIVFIAEAMPIISTMVCASHGSGFWYSFSKLTNSFSTIRLRKFEKSSHAPNMCFVMARILSKRLVGNVCFFALFVFGLLSLTSFFSCLGGVRISKGRWGKCQSKECKILLFLLSYIQNSWAC